MNRFRPQCLAIALHGNLAGDKVEGSVDDKFWPDRAGAQLGRGKVEIVLTLEDMVGEFVANREADSSRRSVSINDVDAGDFRLLAAIVGKFGNDQWFAMTAQNRAAAFIKPFGRNTRFALRRLAAFHATEVHAAAVRDRLRSGVHGIAILSAGLMGESCTAHQASRRFRGKVGGGLQMPVRRYRDRRHRS